MNSPDTILLAQAMGIGGPPVKISADANGLGGPFIGEQAAADGVGLGEQGWAGASMDQDDQ